jgi:phosphatidylserine/phosphatidylglycerophosphate/cardiolipin synthase-like enzyme
MIHFLLILSLGLAVQGGLIEVCPDCGNYEYVKVKVSCENPVLTDGEGKIPISNNFTVVAKNATEFFRVFGFYPDIEAKEVDRKFMLSNEGEEIFLLCDGAVYDKLAYGKSGFGLTSYTDRDLVYFKRNGRWDFRYRDWTNFTAVEDWVKGKIVVLPNDLRFNAKKSLVIASYTLTERLNLKELAEKGVKIEVYLDASPVGGVPIEEIELSKELPSEFYFLQSNSYKNFHYKFAIIDGKRVVITTENWKTSNRGYLIEFESERISNFLLKVLEHDKIYSSSPGKVSGLRTSERFVVKGDEVAFEGRVRVFLLPDRNLIFDLISESKEELLIVAPYMDLTFFGREKLLELIESAGRNGSKVRILLDSRYARERNERLSSFLNDLAKERGYDLEAKIVALKGFEALHGKLIYSDGRCLITSANFNQYGLKLNREIGVVIESEKACNFLKKQFYEDWKERFQIDFSNLPELSTPFDLPLALLSLLVVYYLILPFVKLR